MTQAADEIFGVLRCARRVWAVASVHGEAEKLKALHGALWNRFQPGDRLVYLGNMIGVGPDIPGTLDEILSFRVSVLCRPGMEPDDIVFLRGAQEEMWRKLLQLQFAPDPLTVYEWMMRRGVAATLSAYGLDQAEGAGRCRGGALALTRWTNGVLDAVRRHPGHHELMISLRRAAITESNDLLFVNAGVDPLRELVQQGDSFWWGSRNFRDLDKSYDGFHKVVTGFDPSHSGPAVAAFTAKLDGGCGYGGRLVAGCFSLDGNLDDIIEV